MALAIYRLGELALVRRVLVVLCCLVLLPVAAYWDFKDSFRG